VTSDFAEYRYYRTFKGHISLLIEARVTWLGMLVVQYVLFVKLTVGLGLGLVLAIF